MQKTRKIRVILTSGRISPPPENRGGVWRYADLLEPINDPKNTERAYLLEWLGGPFDPEEVNQRLAPFQRRRSR
jgi:hypothetical protein